MGNGIPGVFSSLGDDERSSSSPLRERKMLSLLERLSSPRVQVVLENLEVGCECVGAEGA